MPFITALRSRLSVTPTSPAKSPGSTCSGATTPASLGSGTSIGAARLRAELQRATGAGSVQEVPKDALLALVQSSHSEEDRHQIMRYLCECLSERDVSKWRSIYLAMAVLEDLFDRGSSELFFEASNGLHFDVVQRLSILEVYDFNSDIRVQNLVRRKATTLRSNFRERQAEVESKVESSTGSQKVCRGPLGWSIAYTTHSEETDDESSDDECAKQRFIWPTPAEMPAQAKTNAGVSAFDPSLDDGSTSASSAGSKSTCSSITTESDQPSSRAAFEVGDLVRAVSIVTMREEEAFESAEIRDFDTNQVFKIIETTCGRRIRVRDLETKAVGWISVRTKRNESLVERCGKQ